jgi:hypothetical protein
MKYKMRIEILKKQINGKFKNKCSLMRINTKLLLRQILLLPEADIQGLHPAEASPGYVLAWFQFL